MEPDTGVTFADVAGCDGSKLELTLALTVTVTRTRTRTRTLPLGAALAQVRAEHAARAQQLAEVR